MDTPQLSWGKTPDDLPELWPKRADGSPEPPAFLTHLLERNLETDLLERMLRSYGIPVLTSRGRFGSLAKLVTGFSGEGVDFFVPAPMLEDAKNLMLPAEDADIEMGETDN